MAGPHGLGARAPGVDLVCGGGEDEMCPTKCLTPDNVMYRVMEVFGVVSHLLCAIFVLCRIR